MKQKPIIKNLFGWYIYISHGRLCLLPKAKNKGVIAHSRIQELRNRRYKKNHGCCEICGKPVEKEDAQMHHILPFSVFPKLVGEKWNMIMVCHRCHYIVHHNHVKNMDLMRRTAREHGIDLNRAYQVFAVDKWNNKLTRKGGLQ